MLYAFPTSRKTATKKRLLLMDSYKSAFFNLVIRVGVAINIRMLPAVVCAEVEHIYVSGT